MLFGRKRRQSLKTGRYARAGEEKILRALTDSAALAEAGDSSGALDCLGSAEVRYPEAYMLHVAEATIHIQLGELARAGECLAIAIALEPENPVAYRRLARVLAMRKRQGVAQAILKRAWDLSVEMKVVKRDEESRRAFFDLEGAVPGSGPAPSDL